MKIKNIVYTTFLTAVLIAAGVSCSKDKFDINANPDDVTDVSVTPSVILPGTRTHGPPAPISLSRPRAWAATRISWSAYGAWPPTMRDSKASEAPRASRSTTRTTTGTHSSYISGLAMASSLRSASRHESACSGSSPARRGGSGRPAVRSMTIRSAGTPPW